MASTLELLKRSGKDFLDDGCPTMAAALAYYTVFSLPPLLILVLLIASALFSPQQVQEALQGQVAQTIGASAGREIQTIFAQAERPDFSKGVASLLGIVGLVVGATGAFGQLQAALNRAWEVEPDPEQGGIRNFLVKRLFSFGMILAIAFLLMVSLALSAAISALGGALALPAPLLYVFNLGLSLAIFTLLFAAMFKILPDAQIGWRDVWVGAFATTLLFVLGKFLIGLYLGRSNPGEAFGAAGSLVLLLVWIYYAAMILLLGAEFTQSWAELKGRGIQPEEGAVRVVEEKRRVRDAATGHAEGHA